MSLNQFEAIVRQASTLSRVEPRNEDFIESVARAEEELHPFDQRNIYPDFPKKVRSFFDDGHYSESTFEAFKYVDKTVQKYARSGKAGEKLMMDVFNENNPKISLTRLSTPSEVDEQRGFKFLFSGGVIAIRNPRGHEVDHYDDVDTCLDHLAFASLLIRRLISAMLS